MFSRVSAWFCGFVCLLFLAGCGGSSDGPIVTVPTNTTVSIYNLLVARAVTPVDVYIDGSRVQVGLLNGVSSGQRRVNGTSSAFGITATPNPSKVYFDGSRTFTNLAQHFGFLVGEADPSVPANAPDLVILEKNTGAAPSGKMQVRFFSCLYGLGAYDIWAGPEGALTRVATNVNYKEASPFVTFDAPATGGTIIVRLALPGQPPLEGDTDPKAVLQATEAESGKVSTLLLKRNFSGNQITFQLAEG